MCSTECTNSLSCPAVVHRQRTGGGETQSWLAEKSVPAAHAGSVEGVAYFHGAAQSQLACKPPAAATARPCISAVRPAAGATGAAASTGAANQAERWHAGSERPASGITVHSNML